MNQPSSTITAAFLAGLAVTLAWKLAVQYAGIQADETTVALSVTFVSSLVGYFKPENVYPAGWNSGPG